ncbi:MAG: NAD-dependent epimerase/dehydratase family protein [Planctomycetaceae bacterium]|nr:NAD-dependent epimerase/dehydratase family protein [Planctomycetaceae bacterium]
MLLLEHHEPRLSRIIAIFGLGLIGRSIVNALSGHVSDGRTFPLTWNDPTEQCWQWASIVQELEMRIARTPSHIPTEVHFLWAAGSAGFLATESEVEGEFQNFERVVDQLDALKKRSPKVSVCLSLVSSVGGLFEGQRNINSDSPIVPMRPYGDLKHRQERLALALQNEVSVRIYRVSTVIGPVSSRGRQGLVAKLVRNGLNHSETVIFGTLYTLRDYVWCEDVGRYIAEAILKPQTKECLQTLAAGKPTSISEVIAHVESALNRRLYVRNVPLKSNASDITVSSRVLPDGWYPRDLVTSIAMVVHRASVGSLKSDSILL